LLQGKKEKDKGRKKGARVDKHTKPNLKERRERKGKRRRELILRGRENAARAIRPIRKKQGRFVREVQIDGVVKVEEMTTPKKDGTISTKNGRDKGGESGDFTCVSRGYWEGGGDDRSHEKEKGQDSVGVTLQGQDEDRPYFTTITRQ